MNYLNYVVGIDAGGTKTKAIAYDIDGNVLTEELDGPGNITLKFEETLTVIEKVLHKIQLNINGHCIFMMVGISGLDTSGKQSEVKQRLVRYAEKIEVINDAKLGLIAKLRGNDGMLVIAGTGSVGYIKKDSQEIRQGGWGHLLGDEGSGYWIGLQCYRKLIEDYDGSVSHQLSKFSREFLKYLKIEDPLEAIRTVYELDKKSIAEKAKFVASRMEFDEYARNILIDAGGNLALLAKKLYKKADVTKNLNIAVTGSVLEKNNLVYSTFCENMEDYTKNIILSSEDNTKAAWYYYQKEIL